MLSWEQLDRLDKIFISLKFGEADFFKKNFDKELGKTKPFSTFTEYKKGAMSAVLSAYKFDILRKMRYISSNVEAIRKINEYFEKIMVDVEPFQKILKKEYPEYNRLPDEFTRGFFDLTAFVALVDGDPQDDGDDDDR
jgi:hypothetical protein